MPKRTVARKLARKIQVKKPRTKKQQKNTASKKTTAAAGPKNRIMQKFTSRISAKKFLSVIIFGTLLLSFLITAVQYISQNYVLREKTVALVGCVGELNISVLSLNITSMSLTECSVNLTGCREYLNSCYGSLASYKSNYTTCDNQLTTCTSQSGSLNSQLTSCNSDKTSCQALLSTCNADKGTCQTNLQTWQTNFTATRDRYMAYKCCGATNYTYYYMNISDVVCTNDGNLSTTTTGC